MTGDRWDVRCTCGHNRHAHGMNQYLIEGTGLCYYISESKNQVYTYCPCGVYTAAEIIIREEDDWDALVN